MKPKVNISHPDEDTLELYVLRTLPESQVVAVEEHLLICPTCQETLVETEDFITAVKTATESLRHEQSQEVKQPWRSFFTLPKPVWAAGFAAAAAMVVLVPMLRENNASVQAVSLSVTRGENAAKPDVKPGRIQVKVDATGIEAKTAYSVEVVTENGDRVVDAAGTRTGNSVEVADPVELRAGQYWVRLYDANAKSEPLREFSLVVR